MIHTIRSDDGSQAQISLNGAHVISWLPANSTEQLFLSSTSDMEIGSAIRGGIPVIFPQFGGLGSLAKHGFVRTQLWQLQTSEEPGSALFELRDSEETRSLWPHPFLAQVRVSIALKTLQVELTIYNTGHSSFEFTAALHTYLRVQNSKKTRVTGLKGKSYRNSVTGEDKCIETADALEIEGNIDHIYADVSEVLTVQQPDQQLIVTGTGFTDAVIWNPGSALGATIPDMEPQGYQRMLCVEAAQVMNPVILPAGKVWHGSQRLFVAQ